MKTILYRYFDSEGQLLYVGITGNQLKRQSQHRRTAVWFDQIASAKFQHFDTREAAFSAEVEAIQQEKPIFNHQHTKTEKSPVEMWELSAKLHLLTILNGTDLQNKPQLVDEKHKKFQQALQSLDFSQTELSFDEFLAISLLEIWMDSHLTSANFEECDLCNRIFDTEWFNETYARAESRLEEEGDYELTEKGETTLCL